jgi:hypothetical protein
VRVTNLVLTPRQVSPDLAHGANLAVEVAAAIANTLRRINTNITTLKRRPTDIEVDEALTEWAKSYQKRLTRINTGSRIVTRAGVHHSFIHRVYHRYAIKYAFDIQFYMHMRDLSSGSTLDFVPFPDRARNALEKFKGLEATRIMCVVAFMPVGLLLSLYSVCREVVITSSKGVVERF